MLFRSVSHTAPYRHFKSKEELINAISEYVFTKFQDSLREIVELYKNNPSKRIIELGKKYVWFMVENPDYLKFAFLTKNQPATVMEEDKIINGGNGTFNIFENCAFDFFKSINVKEEDYVQDLIAMWSMVHGLATMLAYKTISYEGDYLKLVEKILRKNLNF